MKIAFHRFLVGVGMSVMLALPLGQHFLAPVPAYATSTGQLNAEDLIDSNFGDATGLGQQDIKTSVGQLIRVALGFLGVIAVVVMLLGGFKWMVAGGNDEKVEEAKKLIVAGIIGLAIILAAFAIASFVISSIIGATQG